MHVCVTWWHSGNSRRHRRGVWMHEKETTKMHKRSPLVETRVYTSGEQERESVCVCVFALEADVLQSRLQRLTYSIMQPLNTPPFTDTCQHLHRDTHTHTYTHTHTHTHACIHTSLATLCSWQKTLFLPYWLTDRHMDGWMEVARSLPRSAVCVPVQCACVCSSCVDVSTCHKYECLDKLTGFVREPVAKLCRLLPLLLTTVGPTSPSLSGHSPVHTSPLRHPYVISSIYLLHPPPSPCSSTSS